MDYWHQYDRRKEYLISDRFRVEGKLRNILQLKLLHFYLESNHDVDMLINGTYPYPTKQRILSTKGHLSNENAAEVLSMMLKKKKEKILLGHLSSDNNLPELALKTVKDLLSAEHKENNVDYTIDVAPRFLPSEVFEL